MSEENKEITNPLGYIQSNLAAPKAQWNSFSKFHYRSCEDILCALKPLLKEVGCHLLLNDEIIAVEGRVYVKATAWLVNSELQSTIAQTHAFAREPDTKKGMDESQITGTASSYARKYALNGLFLIDDTKEIDSENNENPDAYVNESKPRVAHSVEVKKRVAKINQCLDMDSLKREYDSAQTYFKKWTQPGHITTITEAKDAMKLKLGA